VSTVSTTSGQGRPDSHVSVSAAPARTDLDAHPAPGAKVTGTASARPAVTAREVRRLSLPLVLGALSWSVSSFALGFNPSSSIGITVQDLTGFAFQVGVMCLVVLQLRTAATGLGRGARIMLRVEQVLLSLAMLWSLLHGLVPSIRDAGWLVVLDVFWPLSMLGMFGIGIRIAIAGRWSGASRFWPMVAESWAVVTIPAMLVGGELAGQLVGAGHLLVGYTVLGVLVSRKQA
jgi:hypothetical protein